MADLFSSTTEVKEEVVSSEKQERVFYKDISGKFSDKETARNAMREKEMQVLKANLKYWKRLAENYRRELELDNKPGVWTRIESGRISTSP